MSTSRTFLVRSPRDFARTISEGRIERGLTQAELAAAAGIDRTYLSRMENGFDTKQLDRAFRVFRVLGVQVSARMEIDDHG